MDNTFSDSDESNSDPGWENLQSSTIQPSTNTLANTQDGAAMPGNGSAQKSQSSSPCGSPSKRRSGEREAYTYIQELDQERSAIVREIELEEQQRQWYCNQLEEIAKQMDTLPITENYNLQADMSRRQLEYEASRIRDMMTESLGNSEQIAQRHAARLARIQLLEQQMLRMHHQQAFVSHPSECEYDQPLVVSNALGGSTLSTISTQTFDDSSTPLVANNGKPTNQNLAALYHGGWPIHKGLDEGFAVPDTASVMSFHSSGINSASQPGSRRPPNHQQLGTKVEMVYSLLSMLGTHDKDDMSRTLLAMSSSQDSCIAMRQSGCLPLLIQLLHGSDKDSVLGNTRGSKAARARAANALHNIVHSHPDDKRGRREARVLRLLEQIRAHCDQLRDSSDDEDDESSSKESSNRQSNGSKSADIDHHPGPAIAALMKLSFDEEHRHAICTLGGLQAIAELLQVDHEVNGNTSEQYNITMRRYACMALTNLTFGDGTNKALLCSMKASMRALVAQLQSANEDLRQVAASVLRNLSWRADLASKKTLREVGAVTALTTASMEVKKESTLKSVLSALWNLSAHCSENKADICAVDGSLWFLVSSLTYKSPSKTTAIIENGGGILRNISSHIAVREEYRGVLRKYRCLEILLTHLRSPSLTVVSNACGTLWNLSARCQEDQKALWELGAVNMLRNLVHSKHKMISMGSAAALKNLLSARPGLGNLEIDRQSRSMGPSLMVRKQKALEAEIDQSLAETCENMDSPHDSPKEGRKHYNNGHKYLYSAESCGMYQLNNLVDVRRPLMRTNYHTVGTNGDLSPLLETRLRSPQRSSSQDSVGSTHSDISHDRGRGSNKLLQERQHIGLERRRDLSGNRYSVDGNSTQRSVDLSPDKRSSNRIIQMMQEVAMHAGIDTNAYNAKDSQQSQPQYSHVRESQSVDSSPASMRRSYPSSQQSSGRRIPIYSQNHMIPPYKTQDVVGNGTSFSTTGSNRKMSESLNNKHEQMEPPRTKHFDNLAQRMENLHMNEVSSEDERPVNYSLKYADVLASHNANSVKQNNTAPSSAFKPVPKVGNFVAGLVYGNQPQKVSNLPAPNNTTKQVSGGKEATQFTGYAETDLDHVDEKPTNYSLRYAEQTDDVHFDDQPINYGKRYKEPDSCIEEARRTNAMLDQTMPHDTVTTFCTEGTPLNMMSTATSMNDLREGSGAKSVNHGQKENNNNRARNKFLVPSSDTEGSDEQPTNYAAQFAEYEHKSTTGSQSTDQHTTCTVIHSKPPSSKLSEDVNLKNNNINSDGPGSTASLFSYNDNSGTGSSSSPSEKPTQYCVEGTPKSFSRASSLSSLQSNDAQDQRPNQRAGDLHSIEENDSFDGQNDVTLKADSANTTIGSQSNDSANTSTASKSVTFDANTNLIQETPIMFSRSSSLGSLSSFDAVSVHSSVMSEYSRRASEVVSPSDLPDSPSDTMPSSPSHRKSPIKFDGASPNLKTQSIQQQRKPPTASAPSAKLHTVIEQSPEPKPVLCQDSVTDFAEEGSPPAVETFSCATSLSALTFDDDVGDVKKEPDLRKVPIGQEDECFKNDDDKADSTGADKSDHNETLDSTTDLEKTAEITAVEIVNDNLSDDEGEEDETMLAECMSLAMPAASSKTKKKMKKSESDGNVKKTSSKQPNTELKEKYRLNEHDQNIRKTGGARSMSTSTPAKLNIKDYSAMKFQDDQFACDTPRKYATEGTPLNFSTATSLSDLSMPCIDDDESPKHGLNESDDEKSDVSSISDDCEDLLSETIEAAMPKKSTKLKTREIMDRQAEGSDANTKSRYQNPAIKAPATNFNPVRTSSQSSGQVKQSTSSDTVQVYAQEGTPFEFSRATSLSDLTVDSSDVPLQERTRDLIPGRSRDSQEDVSEEEEDTNQEVTPASHAATCGSYQDDSVFTNPPESCDSPRAYGMEGTPVCFSRNDSLSSLSVDEDEFDRTHQDVTGGKSGDRTSKAGASPKPAAPRQKLFSPKKAGLALKMSRTPNKLERQVYHLGSRSPAPGHNVDDHRDDQIKTYAVEGTPQCFSRNSSLSSLDTDDSGDEHLEKIPEDKQDAAGAESLPDHQQSFMVEDTPFPLSGNSSLSSLSVDSLADDSPSDMALLEECMSAAMPKTSSKHKGKNKIPRPAPSGTSSKAKKTSPLAEDTLEGRSGPASQGNNENSAVPKNVMARDGSQGVPSLETENFSNVAKIQKEVTNLEMIHCVGDASELEPCESVLDNRLQEELELMDSKLAQCSVLDSVELKDDSDDVSSTGKSDRSEDELSKDLEWTKENYNLALELGCTPLQNEEEIDTEDLDIEDLDITKETFPDMGISMMSSTTETPVEHNCEPIWPVDAGDAAEKCDDNDDTPEAEEIGDMEITPTELVKSLSEMSPEEAQALEENANIVLSELSFSALSGSTVEEDQFIEHETISLVSDSDLLSDNLSEISVSSSTKTMSEHASEMSSNTTLSRASSAHVPQSQIQRPRIVKPLNKESVRQQQLQKEIAKPIKGGKKKATPGVKPPGRTTAVAKTTGAVSKTIGAVSKPTPTKPVSKLTPPKNTTKSSPPASGTPKTRTPPKAITKPKTAPPAKPAPVLKTNQKLGAATAGRTSTTSPKPSPRPTKKISPPRPTTSPPKPNAAQTKSSSSPQRPNTAAPPRPNTTPPKAGQSRLPMPKSSSRNASKPTKAEQEDIERPKPPIKQGTFTMDSPTQNAPKIHTSQSSEENTDLNANKTAQQPEEESASGGSNRSSSEMKYKVEQPEKLTCDDDLDSSLADTSLEEDNIVKVKQGGLSVGKNSGKTSTASSRSSLNKTSSGSSLNKSFGQMSKTSSSGSLRGGISQNSLRRSTGSSGPASRSTTPNGSTASSGASKKSTAPGKKVAVSKIAGIWKKDESVNAADGKSPAVPKRKTSIPPANQNGPAASGKTSPKPAPPATPPRRSSLQSKAAAKKAAAKQEQDISAEETPAQNVSSTPAKDTIPKSSTYDKLDDQASTSEQENIEESQDATANNQLWRRTFTLDGKDDQLTNLVNIGLHSSESELNTGASDTDSFGTTSVCSAAPAEEKEKQEVRKKSKSIWKRITEGGDKKDKSKSKEKEEKAKAKEGKTETKKGGLWKKSSDKKKQSKIPSPSSSSNQVAQASDDVQKKDEPEGTRRQRPVDLNCTDKVSSPGANAAIVTPFNYNPSSALAAKSQQQSSSVTAEKIECESGEQHSSLPSPTKLSMTKTEMLIARRQSYLNSLKPEDSSEDDGSKRSPCLVTTV